MYGPSKSSIENLVMIHTPVLQRKAAAGEQGAATCAGNPCPQAAKWNQDGREEEERPPPPKARRLREVMEQTWIAILKGQRGVQPPSLETDLCQGVTRATDWVGRRDHERNMSANGKWEEVTSRRRSSEHAIRQLHRDHHAGGSKGGAARTPKLAGAGEQLPWGGGCW